MIISSQILYLLTFSVMIERLLWLRSPRPKQPLRVLCTIYDHSPYEYDADAAEKIDEPAQQAIGAEHRIIRQEPN